MNRLWLVLFVACGRVDAPDAPPPGELVGAWAGADGERWVFAEDGTLSWTAARRCADHVASRKGTWTRRGDEVTVAWTSEIRARGAVEGPTGCDRSAERHAPARIAWADTLAPSPCGADVPACRRWQQRRWQWDGPR